MIERITDHVERGKALLIGQFRDKPVIGGLLASYLRPFQELEDVLWDIIDKHILDDAVGDQLLHLGKITGEPPLGRSDDDYRAAIRVRIRVNRSKGRTTDILEVAILAAPAYPVRLTEYRFLAFEIEIYGTDGEQYIADMLNLTRAATSYGVLLASDLTSDELLHFDDAVTPTGVETFSDAQSGTGLVSMAAYALG